jgi:hypothetical protein
MVPVRPPIKAESSFRSFRVHSLTGPLLRCTLANWVSVPLSYRMCSGLLVSCTKHLSHHTSQNDRILRIFLCVGAASNKYLTMQCWLLNKNRNRIPQ